MKVPARTNRCQRCHSLFHEQHQVVSFLIFGEEEILRSDTCEHCAGEVEQEMRLRSEGRAMATWRTIPEPAPRPPHIPDVLLSVLRDEVQQRPGLRWLLALYLERQKILLLQRELGGREPERWYELPETGEVFHVMGSRPQRQDLTELQQLMASLPSESRKAS